MLNETRIRKIVYDTGELKKILIKNKMQHLSTLIPAKKSILYNYTSNKQKKNTQNTLLFLPDCSFETWEQIKKLNISQKENYYFIDHFEGLYEKDITEFLRKKSATSFNFIKFFRKSNFDDWNLIILYNDNFNLENIVINTLMSLGANVRPFKKIKNEMIFIKSISLSFQHNIDLYQLAQHDY